jgi:ferric-dicitrate binding protein FerR (iron transport regulator)
VQAGNITLTTASGEPVALPVSLPPEQRVGTDLLLVQDSGMARLLPVARGGAGGEEPYRVVTVPRGGEFKIMLEDGTKVWVNAETRFSFPPEFTGERRVVRLEGEAYFEVARDPAREFLVETPRATVAVYGTSFNLSTDTRRERTVATLVSGAIGFRVHATGEEIPARPGEQVILSGETWSTREVNTRYYTSWREGWLSFSSERLEDMLDVVARWYNVEVVFINEQAREMLYTGQVMKYEDFREVLDIISLTRSVHFSVDDRTIIVH